MELHESPSPNARRVTVFMAKKRESSVKGCQLISAEERIFNRII